MKEILLTVCLAAILMTACDNKEILPGKREAISGITEIDKFEKSSVISSAKISATPATTLTSHIDVAGNKIHNSVNYKMNQNPQLLWKVSLGRGSVNTDPIAFGEKIYVVNPDGDLICISQSNGEKLWKIEIARQPDESSFNGGLTANRMTIYAATNIGDVIAIDSGSQKILWKKSLKYPLRGAPLYASGKVIVNSIDGQTFALDAINGKVTWSKSNPSETTIIASAGTPALYGSDIICAYSSGDLKSLELQSGSENWDEILSSANLSESGAVISHVATSPVISKGNVLAATPDAKMVMFDASAGIQVWDKEIGTLNTPIINSGWVFVLTSDKSVVCLSERDGSTKWISEIRDFYGDKFSKDYEFVGPLLINGDVVIFSNNGDVLRLDISTGKLKEMEKISGMATHRTPLIVDSKLFAITSRADLYAIG